MPSFAWIPFYKAIAKALSSYINKRQALYQKIKQLASDEPLMHYLHFEHEDFWQKRGYEIDPFTVMGIFNRATTPEHRHELAQKVAAAFNVNMEAPAMFHGIAHLDPRKSIYADNNAMWALWAQLGNLSEAFTQAWDMAIAAHGNGLATLSIGLFWADPEVYMPLDTISLPFIESNYSLEPLSEKCSGAEYINYIKKLSEHKPSEGFPAIAFAAWKSKNQG